MRRGWERAQHRAQGTRNQEHRSLLPKIHHCQTCAQ